MTKKNTIAMDEMDKVSGGMANPFTPDTDSPIQPDRPIPAVQDGQEKRISKANPKIIINIPDIPKDKKADEITDVLRKGLTF